MDLREVLRRNWRRAMPVRASRPRGVRGRPRAPDERRALQQVAYRQAVRAFRTRIVREGARQDRLLSGGHVDVESLERRASEEGLGEALWAVRQDAEALASEGSFDEESR